MSATDSPRAGDRRVPLVVIAASAGGLDPISEILDHYPPELPVATVVIQHLSPDYPSELVKLLQSHTRQRVREVQDGARLEAGAVYVIRPGTQIVMRGDQIQAVTRNEFDRPYFTIDVFLESVARGGRPLDACVVMLSGTGSDGTNGCRAMLENGGYVIVQQIADAKFDGMPLSVVNAGVYHELQPTRCIPERIEAWLANELKVPVPGSSARAAAHAGHDSAEAEAEAAATDCSEGVHAQGEEECPSAHQATGDEAARLSHFAAIFDVMRDAFGIDLYAYKIGTIERRIQQRMRKLGVASIDEYSQLLSQRGPESRTLFGDLMIGVTSFFRNPQVFALLESEVLPKMLSGAEGPLKVWVCGCSTGEEAYSIAMLLHKLAAQMDDAPDFRVFATDVNAEAIRRASDCQFDYATLQPFINRFGLQQYVTPTDDYGRLSVTREVRNRIVFSVQNVLRHSPLNGLDMILCRNLLIYLRSEAQRKVVSNFHFGLKPGGMLVLGESEGSAGLEEYFEEIDGRLKVFRKRSGVSLSANDRGGLNRNAAFSSSADSSSRRAADQGPQKVARGSFEAAFAAIAGNSMILREDGEVMYLTGHAGEIFQRTLTGRPSLSLHHHLQDTKLQSVLQLGLSEAAGSEEFLDIDYPYDGEGELEFSILRLSRINAPLDRRATVLVQMLRGDGASEPAAARERLAGQDLLKRMEEKGGVQRLAELERRNVELKQLLAESVEDRETFHEELQSTNEELLASNEELQSTNEELQSVNEELHTVNFELEQKIHQLSEANNDITNLVSNTDLALVFLDRDLRIRRFTNLARNYFPLGLNDIGRPISELASRLSGLDLPAHASETVRTADKRDFEINGPDGRWQRVSLAPYRDEHEKVDGVVITIFDITDLRSALDHEEQERKRRTLTEKVVRIGYWEVPDVRKDRVVLSDVYCEQLGYQPGELGEAMSEVLSRLHTSESHLDEVRAAYLQACEQKSSYSIESLVRRRDGREIWILCVGAFHENSDGVPGMLGVMMDIDARKRAELELSERRAGERHADRIFNIGMLASGVAHELNNPLAALQLAAESLQTLAKTEAQNQGQDQEHNQRHDRNQKLLERISRNQMDACRRMSVIISSLLRFSRKGDSEDRRAVHMKDLIDDVLELTRALAMENEVAVTASPIRTGLAVKCHPVEMAQVLVNLVSNAIHAVASLNERSVEISVREQRGMLKIAVRDSGLASNIKQPDMLFAQFFTTKDVGKGTGLGLALSLGIVEGHGGRLYFDRTEKHTTFVVQLPISEACDREESRA